MPYKCVHCSEIYLDDAPEIANGCSECKSKFFFYLNQARLKEIENHKIIENELSSVEKKQMEKDIRDITGVKDEEKPVFLDFESVKVLRSGRYLLDLQKLFANNKPRVYQIEDGKYIVDLAPKALTKKKGNN